MDALLSNPLETCIGLLFSIIAARKAADLMGTSNRMMAVLFGAALALAGPLLTGTVIAAGFADMQGSIDALAMLLGSEVTEIGSRLGFALVGVLCWSGFERAA